MVGVLAVVLGGAACAQNSGQDELRAIAAASGLQVREVQMLLSSSPTAYTTSYITYDVSARKLQRAVAQGRVHLLPMQNGAAASFAAWQKLPARALAISGGTAVAKADSHSH
ncbi:hypothetical protein ASG75_09110 [Rhodanobacter sp. Soil772]|nr:hypothetical protein ASG75_09110 [Rhodanobacter sp. Soil772]